MSPESRIAARQYAARIRVFSGKGLGRRLFQKSLRLSKTPGRAREGRSPLEFQSRPATCAAAAGCFLRRNFNFQSNKTDSLQAPRPKNLRFLAETGEGGSGGGDTSPPPACQTLFDTLATCCASRRCMPAPSPRPACRGPGGWRSWWRGRHLPRHCHPLQILLET